MAVRAVTLFEVVLPRIIAEKRRFLGQVGGVVEFTVTGDDGGAWSFDLRPGADGQVRRGGGDADVSLAIAADFLDTFASGNYDGAAAVAGGKLVISGNRKVFDAFTRLLLNVELATAAKLEPLATPTSKGVGLRSSK